MSIGRWPQPRSRTAPKQSMSARSTTRCRAYTASTLHSCRSSKTESCMVQMAPLRILLLETRTCSRLQAPRKPTTLAALLTTVALAFRSEPMHMKTQALICSLTNCSACPLNSCLASRIPQEDSIRGSPASRQEVLRQQQRKRNGRGRWERVNWEGPS